MALRGMSSRPAPSLAKQILKTSKSSQDTIKLLQIRSKGLNTTELWYLNSLGILMINDTGSLAVLSLVVLRR